MARSESGRRFNQDRQSGALELLLVTPLPEPAILAGQKQAQVAHIKGSLWALSLVNAALAGWVWRISAPRSDMHGMTGGLFIELFAAAAFFVLLMDFQAIVWLGMWNGLTAKNHQRAVLQTVGQIMTPSWLAIFLLIFLHPNVRAGEAAAIFATQVWPWGNC